MEAAVNRIDEVLLQCRKGVAYSCQLPFLRIVSSFDFQQFRYMVAGTINMRFDTNAIVCCTRLVALLLSIRSNLIDGTKVTKRALYYQLLKYYKGEYSQISRDIKTLSYTLGLKREEMGVIASSRGLLCGSLSLDLNGNVKDVDNSTYFHLPTECSLRLLALTSQVVAIIEKESVFNFLAPQLQHIPQLLLITSKGYPDYSTQAFLKEVAPAAQGIFYVGDLDPYGFDIMLEYAVGDSFEEFGVPTMNWLDIEQLVVMNLLNEEALASVSESMMQEYVAFSKEDQQKIAAVLGREYFSQELFQEHIASLKNQDQSNSALFEKFQRWGKRIAGCAQLGCKLQLESIFKCLMIPAGEALLQLIANGRVV